MKNILLFPIVLLAYGMAATAAPTAKQIAAYDANKRAQLIEWIEQLRVKAGEADKKAEAAQAALTASQAELTRANDNLAILKADIERLDAWGKAQWQRAEDNQRELNKVLPKYHFLKNWVGFALAIAAAGVVLLLIFHFGAPALNTLPGILFAFGPPLITFTAVLTWVQIRL